MKYSWNVNEKRFQFYEGIRVLGAEVVEMNVDRPYQVELLERSMDLRRKKIGQKVTVNYMSLLKQCRISSKDHSRQAT